MVAVYQSDPARCHKCWSLYIEAVMRRFCVAVYVIDKGPRQQTKSIRADCCSNAAIDPPQTERGTTWRRVYRATVAIIDEEAEAHRRPVEGGLVIVLHMLLDSPESMLTALPRPQIHQHLRICRRLPQFISSEASFMARPHACFIIYHYTLSPCCQRFIQSDVSDRFTHVDVLPKTPKWSLIMSPPVSIPRP